MLELGGDINSGVVGREPAGSEYRIPIKPIIVVWKVSTKKSGEKVTTVLH